MNEKERDILIGLGPEVLADSLLDLAAYSKKTRKLIKRLTTSPEKNIERFKKKLFQLTHSEYYIECYETEDFSNKLLMILEDLKAGVKDPFSGAGLVAAFFEADEEIFEHCDDSDGNVDYFFRYDAKELFSDYASRCPYKEKIAQMILKLSLKDEFGVRESLIDGAKDFLPKETIRGMIDTLENWAEKETDKYNKHHFLRLVESLAQQIGDAKLFERTRLASCVKLSTADNIDIARVYLETGEADTALSWLKKISKIESFMASDYKQLLEEIYRRQGNTKKLADLLSQKFLSYHSIENLEALLDVIGSDKQEEIVADAIKGILKNPALEETDIDFLISLGKMDEAEAYLLKRSDKIDGHGYYFWPSIAETMEGENRKLAASLIYRSLLESLLTRAYAKAYHHGIDYLKKLDKMSGSISDWKNFPNHVEFMGFLRETHGRKWSFWGKYEGK